MWTTLEVLHLLAAVPLAFLFVLLVRDHLSDRSARATLFFVTVSLIHSFDLFVSTGSLTGKAIGVAGSLTAASFWVLAKVHFDDDFRFSWEHAALLAIPLVASWISRPDGGAASPLLRLLPKVIGLAFAIHALLTVYVGARSDLVVSRLRLRYVVLWSTGTYIVMKTLMDVFVEGSPVEAPADLLAASVRSLLSFGLIAMSLSVRPEILRPPPLVPEAPVLDPRLAEALHRLVEEAAIYREEGLTIGALAERMAVHEYKVRQLINDQLGFKNFNAFLNHYRVREARRLLADPETRHRNVAEVAYEVGYGSLAPFNRAFKDTTGQTPTEFRSTRLPPPLTT
jgi:AraC-like DNA-binding protein